MTFSNWFSCSKIVVLWFKFHWESPVAALTQNCLVPNRQQVIIWASDGWVQWCILLHYFPDSKHHWPHVGPTWILSAPRWAKVGPTHLAICVCLIEFIGWNRVSPIKYAHCFLWVYYQFMVICVIFSHILQGCFSGTGTNKKLPCLVVM